MVRVGPVQVLIISRFTLGLIFILLSLHTLLMSGALSSAEEQKPSEENQMVELFDPPPLSEEVMEHHRQMLEREKAAPKPIPQPRDPRLQDELVCGVGIDMR